jgi:hypothetical protein
LKRDDLMKHLVTLIEAELRKMEESQTPGSVIAAIHCDSHGARKVVVSTESSWQVARG